MDKSIKVAMTILAFAVLVVPLVLFVLPLTCRGYSPEFPFSREEKRQVGLEYGHLTPQWSSDGQLIAFGGYGHIHTIKANGRGLQIISEKNDDVHTAYRSPNTSRDGARIAYIAFVHKRLWPLEADFQWEIVTSELDGSSKRRLTKSSKEEEFYVANLNPVWSPDGTRIAFTSNNLPDGVRYFTVFTMAADGSDVRGIVPSIRSKVSFDRDRLYDPLSWSPDSRSLAFVATKIEGGVHRYVLYTFGADGSGVTSLGETTSAPAWSPDSSQIAFVRLVGDTYTLFASDTDGSNLAKIVEWKAASHLDIKGLSWSSDGARLLMFGRSSVGIVNVDGTGFRSFSIGNYLDGNVYASWSWDGSRIAIFTRLDRSDFNNGFDIVLFTMRPDGTDSRTLVRYKLNPGQLPSSFSEGRLEAARGEPVPSRFLEKITVPPPTSISLSASATSSESKLVQRQDSPERPLCDEKSGNPCVPRDVSSFDLFATNSGVAAYDHGEASSVEDVLEDGLHLIGASPTHIAFRGTAQESGVRCGWRGVARTVGQREGAIRFWLGMDDNEPLPSAVQVEADFMSYINRTPPRYRDFVAASFIPVVRGGLSTERLTLTCYADYGVHEYLLGSGPAGASTKLSVAYDRMGEARSYELYSRSHAAGEFGPATSTPMMSEGEYQTSLERTVSEAESTLADIIEGHQAIVFLAPMGAHNAIAVEAWQAVAQWDVQRAEDGTVNAVRYGAHEGDPEHTQTLVILKGRIATTTATATTTRIASVSGLNQYYRDIGAYDDITPGDNATTTFTPAQQPPVYAPRPASLSATASGEESADLSWPLVSGTSGYHVQHRLSDAGERWTTATSTLTGTAFTVVELRCNATHDFRVGAYGDGVTYNSRAGLWSPTATTTTDTCSPRPPEFESASYEFDVSVAVRAGESVGKVTAFDLNDDPITYSIISGNGAGTFAIASSTGEMTMAGGPGAAVGTTYTLTVGASDGVSGTTSVTVTVTVVEVDCGVGAAVANPGSNLELVSDCETLLGLRNLLSGTATLNWSVDTPITSWDGVTVGGTPRRVTRLVLERRGLTGELPTELGLLTGLEELNVSLSSQLTGLIPAELGDLANLRTLQLHYNRLTGPIPPELGGLSKLTDLQLHGNALNGPIPPELGNLSELVNLYLGVNYLTGPIPVELSRLAQL